MPTSLQGKTVLVAGAGGPLVSALVSRLASEGAAVRLLQDDRTETSAHADPPMDLGRVDVLLNVILPIPATSFLDLSQLDLCRFLPTTLGDSFRWSLAVGRSMALSDTHGMIVNVLGGPSHRSAGSSPFAPTLQQGCIVAFTQALAAELADRQIQVNAVVGPSDDRERPALHSEAESIIGATLFLCATHGRAVNGEIVYVAGGSPMAYGSAAFPS